MVGKAVKSSFMLLSKFGLRREESALKAATSNIHATLKIKIK